MNQLEQSLSFDSPMFQRDEEDNQNRLLVIQCDSGHLNGDLIACARYRVYDERINALNKNKIQNRDGVTHVLFIINLPHQVSSSTFVGFQGDPWISCHIDDLRPTSSDTIEPLHAIATNISELFIGEYICDIVPLLGTTPEQIPRQLSESESEESPLDTGEAIQGMTLRDDGGEADVEDEGSESEDDVGEHQLGPEPQAESSPPQSSLIDHAEQLEQLPGQALIPFEATAFGPQQQQMLEDQEDETPCGTGLATAINLSDDMEVIDIEMKFPSNDIPQDGNVIQNLEPLTTAYQENPVYFESVDHERHPGLSLPIHELVEAEPVEAKPAALPSMDESVAQSQAVFLVEPEVPKTLIPTDMNSESEVIPPTPLVIQKSVKRQPRSGQCRRLYTCIQAAASRLEDSTKDRSTQRVTRLTKLIQRSPVCLRNKIFAFVHFICLFCFSSCRSSEFSWYFGDAYLSTSSRERV